MSAAASPRATWRERLRASIGSSAALAVIATAAVVVMNELDRLIADVLPPSGRIHSLSSVIGPGAALETEAWGDWAAAGPLAAQLVVAHTLADLVFIACYTALLVRLVRHLAAPGTRGRRWGLWSVAAITAADLLEDALLLALSLAGTAPTALVVTQVIVSYLKWAAVLVFLGFAVLGVAVGDRVRAAWAQGWRGLYAQRLVAIAVGAIATVSLVTADGVLEQLADVYRSWLGYGGLDLVPLLAALVAFAVTGVGLFWLTRGRARRYASSEADERPDAPLAPWFVVAGVVAVIGIALGVPQNRSWADWVPLAAFLFVLLAIPLISLGVRRRGAAGLPEALRSPDTSGDAGAARRAGDGLIAAWIALAGLGPLKSLVTPIALESTGAFADSRFASALPGTVALAVGYLALAVAGVVIFRRWSAHEPAADASGAGVRPTLEAALQPGEISSEQQRLLRRLGLGVLAVSGAVVVAFLLAPMAISATLGAPAVIVLLTGAWAGILGWLTLTLGRSKPLEVFRVLRLRSAPVVTLLIVLPVVASSVQNAPGLHAVRFPVGEGLPDRPTLAEAYADWYAGDSCVTELGGVEVKPLVLVAAEGGGIRAATWTVDVLRELPRASECASKAVFASTGASGGSIGLATFRSSGNPRGDGEQSTIDIGGDDALSADLAGLLAGDLVGAATGIRVPSSGAPHTDGWAWRDRTALQETTWEAQAPQLARPFDADPVAPTGYLVLGSTDSTSLCKVLVSQLDLTAGGWAQTSDGAGAQTAAAPDCTARRAELADTIDLVDYLGACRADLSWASAAELSARFPFVSPAGRIAPATLPDGCRRVADLQLVDGGIIDNSALGTWVDIAPALTSLIRSTNAAAAAGAGPYVVPVVLFATNEPGSDVLVAPDGTRPEALVPFAAMLGAKGAQVSPAAWLRRASDAYREVCPPADSGCASAVAAVRGSLPGGAVVASPSTGPAVSAPLGWSLSSFSRSRLRFEAEAQAVCGRDPSRVPASTLAAHADDDCRASGEYGSLGELLDAFDAAHPQAVTVP